MMTPILLCPRLLNIYFMINYFVFVALPSSGPEDFSAIEVNFIIIVIIKTDLQYAIRLVVLAVIIHLSWFKQEPNTKAICVCLYMV